MSLNAATFMQEYRYMEERYGKASSSAYEKQTSFWAAASQVMEQNKVAESEATQPLSLEERLKARYPGLTYHVFDGSSGYWRTRNDYPHYLLYQKNIDTKALENWEPKGPNPAYQDSKAIKALGSVPPGSKAVVIHPKVQARMEQDPAYADEIMARIEAWFTFDVVRNEAILPGSTADMSQSVVIGEDGNIANACSSSPGRITYSKSGSDEDVPDFWDLRMQRHKHFMKLWKEHQIEHSMGVSQQFAAFHSAQAAKSQLIAMINDPSFREALGDTLAGIPVEKVFEITMQQVEEGLK